MIGLASLASLCIGVTLAGLAPRAGLPTRAFETLGGLLLVAGLALLGSELPVFH